MGGVVALYNVECGTVCQAGMVAELVETVEKRMPSAVPFYVGAGKQVGRKHKCKLESEI